MPIDNFAPGTDGKVDMGAIPYGSEVVLPERPIPVFLDRYQLEFSADEVVDRHAELARLPGELLELARGGDRLG